MLGAAQLCIPTVASICGTCTDESNSSFVSHSSISIPNLSSSSSSSSLSSSSLYFYHYRFPLRLSALKTYSHFSYKHKGPSSTFLISCRHPRPSFDPESYNDDHRDYAEASVLFPETAQHYRFLKQGFQDELKWRVSPQFLPFSAETKHHTTDAGTLGLSFLRQFTNPTIFLKISCGGDFLLPIIVGEFAIRQLLSSVEEDKNENCPNQYQFVRNLVDRLGYEVKVVKITERVVNTYYARIYISKVGQNDDFSVDARPSDAINVARRYKAPIYVNRRVVLSDAIRIANGTGRSRGTKTIYDVSLDSAAEGTDVLAEELDIVRNMNLAVRDERYIDAAMWRDKLMKLRRSGLQH